MVRPEDFTVDELPQKYRDDVECDIQELKKKYKYVERVIFPLAKPYLVILKIIAVNNHIIEKTGGVKEDFIGDYSKEITVVIPIDYKNIGCYVYGAKWVEIEKIPEAQRHFFLNGTTEDGYKKICVGAPSSHREMKNPILENVRTAEHILFEYELFLSGFKKRIDLIEYSHGDRGEEEYQRNAKRYKTR